MLRALGHLAARELGLAQGAPLTPRVPSAYEPNLVPGESPASREPGMEPAASARIDVRPAPSGETPAVVVDSRHGEMHIAVQSRAGKHRGVSPHIAERASPATPMSATASSLPVPSPPTTVPPRVEWRAPADSPLLPLHTAAPSPSDHGDPLPLVSSRPAPVDRLAPAAHDSSKRTAGEPARTAAPLRPLPPPPSPARAAAPNATAAPVQITIGRIEIRAAKDRTSTPAPSSRAAQTPSLAAYLRRRSDGGRS